MSTIEPTTDNLIVQRGSDLYTTTIEDMSTIQDDDLVMIGRGSESYKINGKEFKEQAGGGGGAAAPEIFNVTLTGSGTGFDNETYTTNVNYNPGSPEAALSLKAKVDGALSVAGNTSEIVSIDEAVSPKSWNIGNPGFTYSNNSQTITRVDAGYGYVTLADTPIPTNSSIKFSFTYQSTTISDPQPVFTTVVNETRANNSDRGGYIDTYTNGWAMNIRSDKVIYYKNGPEIGRTDGGTPYQTGENVTNEFEITITRDGTTQLWGLVNKTNGYSDSYALSDTYAGPIYMAFTSNNYAVVLTSNGIVSTEFTLASDENLSNGAFVAGDTVKQNNSPIVPTSSEITNVAVATYSSTVTAETGFGTSDGPENGFDGNTQATGSPTYCQTNTSNRYVQWDASSYGINTSTSLVRVWAISSGDDIRCAGSTGTITIDATDNVNGNVVPDVGNLTSIRVNNPAGLGGFSGISVDGSLLVDGTSILTLTDASGLSDFEVGDVVEGYTSTDVGVTGQTTGTNTVEKFVEAWDTPGGSGNASLSTTIPGDYVEFSVPQAGTLVLSGGRSSSIDVNITATGDFTGGDQDFIWIAGLRSQTFNFATPGVVRLTTTNSSNGIYINNTTSTLDGATFSFADPVLVTAINSAAPSITTDGGTWNVGEVVTGPPTDITATFVSADPSVPSMTVSAVVGPWSANTGNFVENTVVNPITVEPETSAITAVASVAPTITDTIQIASAIDQIIVYDDVGGTTTKVYNGAKTPEGVLGLNDYPDLWTPVNPNSYKNDSNMAAGISLVPAEPLSITCIGSAPFKLLTVSNLGGGGSYTYTITGDVTVTGTTGGSQGRYKALSDEVTITPNTSGATFTITANNGMYINYVPLGGETTLTLTDDTDLNQFATGDAVYANGVAPQSFAPVTYTGTGSTQSIDVGFAPDLIWTKIRSGGGNNTLQDTVRGIGNTLYANLTNVQGANNFITSVNSDGFTLSNSVSSNEDGQDFVAWCWDAGGTTVTNNDGATEATVRSNGDFSVVKAALGSATTLGHGLNSIPAMVVSKSSSKSSGWFIHLPGEMNIGQSLSFNTAGVIAANIWSGVMTDKVINFNANNQVGGTEDWIFYCWAESPTQNFGSYTGNASNTGPVIDCGFGPAFVMVKNATGSGDWVIVDTGRDNGKELYPNLANAESSASYRLTITSSGFQVTSSSAIVNDSGATFIYAAFATGAGPAGVVGDITSLDMTLSESTGTWEVGQTVTMDPKAVNATTGYLSFDSGTGNVESILLGDPGFKPSPPNNALNFVDPMTGQTWDEELPAGTTLSTKVQAVNTIGSSTSDWASITPVQLTTNMTASELNAAYTNAALLIATFDNRHKVHCGNKAEEERDALITKLAEAGYSITNILDYL